MVHLRLPSEENIDQTVGTIDSLMNTNLMIKTSWLLTWKGRQGLAPV